MRFSTISTAVLGSVGLAVAQGTAPDNGIGSLPVDRHYISAVQAAEVVAAAYANATAVVPQNIAVVDPSGLLVAFLRMDNAYPGSIDISQKKARTAVLFNGVTSGSLYNATLPTGNLYGLEETNGGLVVFGGGLPIYDGQYLVGAIGVSGGSVAQDIEVATAGVEGFNNLMAIQNVVCSA